MKTKHLKKAWRFDRASGNDRSYRQWLRQQASYDFGMDTRADTYARAATLLINRKGI